MASARADAILRLTEQRYEDDRDGDRKHDPGEAQDAEGAPLSGAGAGLGRVGIGRRRRLARQLVLALEDLRIVLDLTLGHARQVPP
jgi:hypothetical protein